jgi:hypothetical protein
MVTLLNISEASERRLVKRLGAIVVVSIVVATVLYLVVNPFGGRSRDVISVSIDTPYVGQGVAVGTPVIIHGVKIGQVVSVSSISTGGVRLKTDLQPGPTRGLTDAMEIDYRPSNYFGVTGINVIAAQSGHPLQNGMQISIKPKGNFSLQALLYRLGELSNGVFNQRMVSVIERATRYANGLTPLLETVLMVGTSVAKVQTVSTDRLLRNTAGVSVAFPSFMNGAISVGNKVLDNFFGSFDPEKYKKGIWAYYPVSDNAAKKHFDDFARFSQETKAADEYFNKEFFPWFNAAQYNLFYPIGNLESSHINDLSPVLESVRTLVDVVPKTLSPDSFAATVTELRQRFERMYAGSGDQRALQVRITLDRLPGVAAPLGLATGGSS